MKRLIGKTIKKITGAFADSPEIYFHCEDGVTFEMYHRQNCCESVFVEDICGEIDHLINSPILFAEKSTNTTDPAKDNYDESYTWTFYRIGTNRGTVVIRWYGSSNGYYSEEVDFDEVKK